MDDAAAQKARLVAEQFGKAAESYNRSPFFPLCDQRLADLAEIPAGAQVLYVATGTGAVLLPAARCVGPEGRVIGLDIAGPMVAVANSEISRRMIQNAEARQMDATNLGFANDAFDYVLCGFVLWFIPDLERALSEIRRVLRPGGRLAVSTWGPSSDFTKRYFELFRSHGGQANDLSSHAMTTPEAVAAILKAAGFEILRAQAEDISVVYQDKETWWEQRAGCFQAGDATLAADALKRLKNDAFRMIQGFKDNDGIHENRSAVFVFARKPR